MIGIAAVLLMTAFVLLAEFNGFPQYVIGEKMLEINHLRPLQDKYKSAAIKTQGFEIGKIKTSEDQLDALNSVDDLVDHLEKKQAATLGSLEFSRIFPNFMSVGCDSSFLMTNTKINFQKRGSELGIYYIKKVKKDYVLQHSEYMPLEKIINLINP